MRLLSGYPLHNNATVKSIIKSIVRNLKFRTILEILGNYTPIRAFYGMWQER